MHSFYNTNILNRYFLRQISSILENGCNSSCDKIEDELAESLAKIDINDMDSVRVASYENLFGVSSKEIAESSEKIYFIKIYRWGLPAMSRGPGPRTRRSGWWRRSRGGPERGAGAGCRAWSPWWASSSLSPWSTSSAVASSRRLSCTTPSCCRDTSSKVSRNFKI